MLPVLADGTYALARAHLLRHHTAPIVSQDELTHVHAVAVCLCGFVLLATDQMVDLYARVDSAAASAAIRAAVPKTPEAL